jgi:hypothetical protein
MCGRQGGQRVLKASSDVFGDFWIIAAGETPLDEILWELLVQNRRQVMKWRLAGCGVRGSVQQLSCAF